MGVINLRRQTDRQTGTDELEKIRSLARFIRTLAGFKLEGEIIGGGSTEARVRSLLCFCAACCGMERGKGI